MSKTQAGERTIPLNAGATESLRVLRERAQSFAGTEPAHFVFPSCENDRIDPTKPVKSWRTAWRRMTREIECPSCGTLQAPGKRCSGPSCRADISKVKSPLAELRFHDLRHHAITELAESQVSDQTIMSIAGHVSPRMLARYSHVRVEAKRKALDGLAERGYDTNHDTKQKKVIEMPVEMIEKNGRHEETRTPDLYRVKVAL